MQHPDGVTGTSEVIKHGKSQTSDVRELQEQLEVVKTVLKRVISVECINGEELNDLAPLVNEGLQEVL